MRPPERLDAIDEARPSLESAPDSDSILTRISDACACLAVFVGCFSDDVIGCRFGGFGQPLFRRRSAHRLGQCGAELVC